MLSFDCRDGDRLRSVVLIKEVESEHLGQFRCELSNRFGTNSALIQLREKGELNHFTLFYNSIVTITSRPSLSILMP